MPNSGTHLHWWQHLARRFAMSRVGSWIFSYTLHHIDRVLLEISDGRLSIPSVFAGLSVIRLTTTGAKTGMQRTVPLVGLRDDEQWFLVASNWGGETNPAWYHNLKANPMVTLSHNNQTMRCESHEVKGEVRGDYWDLAVDSYPGYDAYQQRAGEREIPIIVLDPVGE